MRGVARHSSIIIIIHPSVIGGDAGEGGGSALEGTGEAGI
jgi:hypothetical protein